MAETSRRQITTNKCLDDCVCEICIDESRTESVQYYTVRSKFTVSTLTCLDHLAVREDCECDVKQCVVKPRHLIFLLDSSDSMGGKWFTKSKEFVSNFLQEARFDKRTAPTVISVYNFSGIKPAAKDYVPGSDGAGPAPEMPHYRVEIDAKVWNGTSFKAKQELIEKVEKAPQLDGNGQLYLILQDLSSGSFLEKSEKAMGKAPAGTSKDDWQPERILVIVSDNEWDLNGLKDSNGKPAEKEKIASQVRESYDRIYTAMGSETSDASMTLPSTGLNQFAKPTQKSFLFNSETIDESFKKMTSKIFDDLNLRKDN